MKKLFIFSCFILSFQTIKAQYIITKLWDKTIGGLSHESTGRTLFSFDGDFLPAIEGRIRNYLLSDGSILICGSSYSNIGGDKSQNLKGRLDIWIVSIDSSTGQKLWDKDFGSFGSGRINYFNQFAKIGNRYLMSIYSYEPVAGGDFSISSPYTGTRLIRLLVLDSTFNKVEDRIVAGNSVFQLPHIAIDDSSNYCVALLGFDFANSDIDDTSACTQNVNTQHSALACFKENGIKLWDKIYVGSVSLIGLRPRNNVCAIHALSGGGFIFSEIGYGKIGCTATDSSVGSDDINLYRVDNSGNVIWQRYLGGIYNEAFYSDKILPTTDGNFLIAAMTASPQGGEVSDPEPDPSSTDSTNQSLWIVKFDPSGNILWDKRYGACHNFIGSAAINTQDGGFLIGSTIGNFNAGIGNRDSLPGCDVKEIGRGSADYWVLKLNSDGDIEWDKRWGGSERDGLCDLAQLDDGSYLATGLSYSSISGDKSEDNKDTAKVVAGSGGLTPRSADFWVVRFKAEKIVGLTEKEEPISIQLKPNPIKDFCTIEAKNIVDAHLTLFDITGRILFSQTFNSKSELDLRKLSSGVYIVQLKTKKGMSAKIKIVKE